MFTGLSFPDPTTSPADYSIAGADGNPLPTQDWLIVVGWGRFDASGFAAVSIAVQPVAGDRTERPPARTAPLSAFASTRWTHGVPGDSGGVGRALSCSCWADRIGHKEAVHDT